MLAAIGIAWLLLPAFNNITGKTIHVGLNTRVLLSITGIVLFTGIVAGSYPALYLSKFKPLAVLKGKMTSSLAEIISRKGLVVFQFSLTVIIIAVIIIYQQIEFIEH